MVDTTDDMVVFLMPDGTKVSNDPRFDIAKAQEEMLASRPNRGDMGIPTDEQEAQTLVPKAAAPNSTQPGVGPEATIDDPVRAQYGPLGSPAQQRQKEDMEKAAELGANPKSTAVDDDDPVDSNEKVLALREEKAKAAEKARKAMEDLGDEGPGDNEKPLSEWSGAQLKAEALRRNADESRSLPPLELKGVKKKSDLVALLEKDNEALTAAAEDEDDSDSSDDDDA